MKTKAKTAKKHSPKKLAKFEARRVSSQFAAQTYEHVVHVPTTYADEKMTNRAPAILAKEARVAKEALLASMLPPGSRAPSLAPSGEFVRHCPYARRRGGRNRAYMKSRRGYMKAAMYQAGMEAYRAQGTIERVFATKAGMSWMDVQRALTAKKWSWKNINHLAMHHNIGTDLALAQSVEKQKEAA